MGSQYNILNYWFNKGIKQSLRKLYLQQYWYRHLFYLFMICLVLVRENIQCLSGSVLFHSTWCPLVRPVLLQMVDWYSIVYIYYIIPNVCMSYFLYPLIWWWSPWLIKNFEYCNQGYHKHNGATVFLDSLCSNLLDIYLEVRWLAFKEISALFSTMTAIIYKPSKRVFSALSPQPGLCLLLSLFWIWAILSGMKCYPIAVLICISFEIAPNLYL